MQWERIEEAGYQKRLSSAIYKKRNIPEYTNWRNKVLCRDGNLCILCGSSKDIEVHHISRWIDAPLQKFKVSNGCVLCRKCHKNGHTNKGKDFNPNITLKLLDAIKRKYKDRLKVFENELVASNVIRRVNKQISELDFIIGLFNKKQKQSGNKIIIRKQKRAEPDEVGSRASAAQVRLTIMPCAQ